MTKPIKITISFILLLLAFFAGVNYSDSVKESAGWLFEGRGDEVELPDLSTEEGVSGEVEAPLDISTQDSSASESAEGEEAVGKVNK